MKKIISLSVFIIMVLMVVLVKASQAQPVITHIQSTTMPRASVAGHWKWSPRLHRYVWIDGYRKCAPIRRVRIRVSAG